MEGDPVAGIQLGLIAKEVMSVVPDLVFKKTIIMVSTPQK